MITINLSNNFNENNDLEYYIMNNKGFTLIELILVIIVIIALAILGLQKFISVQNDARMSVMLSMKSSISSIDSLIAFKINMNPQNLNINQNRFILGNGQSIRVRGKLPDGRWDNTFAHILNFSNTAQVTQNDCIIDSLEWCVRQRSANWFVNRGYSVSATGRGFVIFPKSYNVNSDRCYIYYLNKNDSAIPTTVLPSIIGSDFSEC